jgi:hypothetical protein
MATSATGLQRRIRRLVEDEPPRRSAAAGRLRTAALALASAAPFTLPTVTDQAERTAPAPPLPSLAASAPLPAPLAALADDVALLQTEIATLRGEVARAGLGDDAALSDLLGEIERRIGGLAQRCRSLIERYRNQTDPLDLR